MNNKPNLKYIFEQIAEQAVPKDPSAWDKIQARMRSTTYQSQPLSKHQHPARANAKIGWTVGLTALLLFGFFFFLSPLGQVTGDNIWKFFFNAEKDTLPIPTGISTDAIMQLPTLTPVPTKIVSLQPVHTQNSENIFVPTPKNKSYWQNYIYGLNLSEAEELAGYPILTLGTLPSGYQLTDVSYESQIKEVQQTYIYFPRQTGEMFIFTQQPIQTIQEIGKNATIEKIIIGDVEVEEVSGTWFPAAGSDQQEWISSDNVHTYRWQKNNMYYSLHFLTNEPYSPAYLSSDDMENIVEMAVGIRKELPETVNLNDLNSIEEAEKISGFSLLAPGLLPEDFVLERVVYEPDNYRTVAIYNPFNGKSSSTNPSLIIYEIHIEKSIVYPEAKEDLPASAIEQVPVNSFPATFRRGAIIDNQYNPDIALSLHWETDDLSITVNYTPSSSHPARITKEQLIEIAESMK